jgi:hypothetical protein
MMRVDMVDYRSLRRGNESATLHVNRIAVGLSMCGRIDKFVIRPAILISCNVVAIHHPSLSNSLGTWQMSPVASRQLPLFIAHLRIEGYHCIRSQNHQAEQSTSSRNECVAAGLLGRDSTRRR